MKKAFGALASPGHQRSLLVQYERFFVIFWKLFNLLVPFLIEGMVDAVHIFVGFLKCVCV